MNHGLAALPAAVRLEVAGVAAGDHGFDVGEGEEGVGRPAQQKL